MEATGNKMPLYAKTALIFISMFAFVYTMYIGQQIIIPLVYATIIAILLNPVVNFLTRHKFNRLIAIILSVILAIAIVVGILAVLISQGDNFMNSAPEMQEKFNATFSDLVNWVSHQMGVKPEKINEWVADARTKQLNNLEVKENIAKFGHMLMTTVLLPVYMVMLLYYKPLLLEFIHRVFRSENQALVEDVLAKTKKIIQSYLMGLFIEMFIVGVLNTVGLLIIGIKYAVLLGLIGALLNIIPYLGAIIATSIFMLIALLTESPIYMLYVLLMYLFIQFIDNNFLLPKIVASRVKINALVSIIVVLLGAAVWGVPGMFLAIPLTAILKVIFDHIEPLKPWGFLLGDTMPKAITLKKISFRKKTTTKSD
ncbi:MAG: AI-2E family transporter [Bacteroidota bacterium]